MTTDFITDKQQKQLYRVAYSYLRHPQDAEDAVQAALEKALVHQDQLKDQSKVKSWMTRILVNECHQIHRTRIRRQQLQKEITGQASTVREVDYAQSLQLKDALALLTDEQRSLIVLKHLAGYRQREIAAIMEIPTGTVKSRLSRATDALKALLGGESHE